MGYLWIVLLTLSYFLCFFDIGLIDIWLMRGDGDECSTSTDARSSDSECDDII